ncbi:MAG: SRPBCC domain-containing protein [Cyanobacteria bacterium P01_A01_bin.37]
MMSDQNSLSRGRAITVKKIFSRQTAITVDIASSPETIWTLLTDTDSFKSWNSTIIELTGKIALGETIQLRSTLAPKRIFKLKVKEFEPHKCLSWGDAMGTRIYTLIPNSHGGTSFTMSEKIGGPLFPLFARMIPSFDESFNQFAADLKLVAEGNA